MNTKNMTVEQAEKEIEFLKKRIDFNNRINKIARKFMKDHEMGWGKKNALFFYFIFFIILYILF